MSSTSPADHVDDFLSPEQRAGIRVTIVAAALIVAIAVIVTALVLPAHFVIGAFTATCTLSFISLPFIMAAIQDESERSGGPAGGKH